MMGMMICAPVTKRRSCDSFESWWVNRDYARSLSDLDPVCEMVVAVKELDRLCRQRTKIEGKRQRIPAPHPAKASE